MDSIYDYQVAVDGETIEWDLADYAPPSGYGVTIHSLTKQSKGLTH